MAAMSSTWPTAALCVLLCACGQSPAPVQTVQVATPPAVAQPLPDPVEPLSEGCSNSVKLAERQGVIRPGTVETSGAVILTDARWISRMDVDLQKYLAECTSHYLAGGQNRWIKRVQFRNQRTGVVYATIEGDRFRIGE